MSGTCIVCLGDLGESSSEVPALSSALAKSPAEHGLAQQATITIDEHTPPTNNNDNDEESALIAHLKPCGHYLHNDCLTPWVERANSCPICRQSFYTVELSDKVGGRSHSRVCMILANSHLLRRHHIIISCRRQSPSP